MEEGSLWREKIFRRADASPVESSYRYGNPRRGSDTFASLFHRARARARARPFFHLVFFHNLPPAHRHQECAAGAGKYCPFVAREFCARARAKPAQAFRNIIRNVFRIIGISNRSGNRTEHAVNVIG